jgi:hypothetical protein
MLNSNSSNDWSVPKNVQKLYPYREHIERHLLTDIYSFHKPIAHLFGGQYEMKFMSLESEY